MSVTESERNQLFAWFEEHMDRERAEVMMRLLPPVGWADVATKRDLDRLSERVDAKIDAVAARLDAKIDTVDTKLGLTIDGKLEALRSDLQRTFVTWILIAQTSVIGAVGLMLLALR